MKQSIRSILDHYSIDYKEQGQGSDELLFICPFHNDENFGSAYFNEEESTWYCFSCAEGGNDVQFVAKLEGCDTQEAWILLTTDFTGKRDYEAILHRPKAKPKDTNVTRLDLERAAASAAHRMLSTMSQRRVPNDVLFFWIKVCRWLYAIPKDDVGLRYTQVFDIYEDFVKDVLHEEVSSD